MNVAEYQAMIAAEQDEHGLQVDVTRFLERALPADVVWTAVDHAAKLSKRQAGDRKRRGVKRGQPDYRFVLPPDGRSGEIELKRLKGGSQSPEQKAWERAATAAGGLYAVCRSVAEVAGTLQGWGVKLRGQA